MTTLIPADTCAPPQTLRESLTRNERIEAILKAFIPYMNGLHDAYHLAGFNASELWELIEAAKRETAQ